MATREAPGRTATATTSTAGRPFTIIGFVLAAIALFVVPILFGPAGAVFGGIGYAKGDRPMGMWALAAGVVATIGGFVIAALVMSNT